MIQRIQSVYLVLGMLTLAALLFFDSIWGGRAAEIYSWYAPTILIMAALAILVAVVALFSYKDRPKQRSLVLLTQVLTLVLAVVLFGGLYFSDALVLNTTDGGLDLGLLMGMLLPLVAYFLFLLARRAVTNDIKLVKSMDRLRD